MAGETLAEVLPIASRLVWYAGMLGVIGASAFSLLVRAVDDGRTTHLQRATASVGLVAATVLLAGTLARLYAQTYASFGLEEPVTIDLLLLVATDLPPWSTGWMGQATAAAAALLLLAAVRAGVRGAWAPAHLAAVAVAASAPFTGHAVAQAGWYALPIVLQAGHVLGAGVWMGGLFVLLGVARVWRRDPVDAPALSTLVHAFSPIALAGAGLLALTGFATAALYVGASREAWSTPYGATLVLKIAVFGGIAAAGFVNWQYVRPRLRHGGGAQTLRRTAAVELLLAAIAVALTAVLVGLPQPGEVVSW